MMGVGCESCIHRQFDTEISIDCHPRTYQNISYLLSGWLVLGELEKRGKSARGPARCGGVTTIRTSPQFDPVTSLGLAMPARYGKVYHFSRQ